MSSSMIRGDLQTTFMASQVEIFRALGQVLNAGPRHDEDPECGLMMGIMLLLSCQVRGSGLFHQPS